MCRAQSDEVTVLTTGHLSLTLILVITTADVAVVIVVKTALDLFVHIHSSPLL